MTRSRFAALLLVVVCSVIALPASASIVSTLTGDFYYTTFSYSNNALNGYFYPPLGGSEFYLDPTITSYNEYTQCYVLDYCITYYWGTFRGGSGQVVLNSPSITLNALGIYGSFSGYYSGDQWETDSFSFRGTWSNGWYSTFNGYGTNDLFYGGSGSIAIYTQTVPEPTSIALLGSGLLGLIAYGRKRLPGGFVL